VDVILENLATGAGARGGQSVGGVDQHGLDRGRVVVAVVALHGVDDLPLLAILLEDLASELEVRPFHLPIDGFADVV
jgi:hypothetical protein